MMTNRFENKVILISGGASGAGRATSLRFAQEGAQVAIVDIQVQAGTELVQEIEAMGQKAIFIEADVSKADAVKAAVQKALETFGEIHILYNHAGTVIVKPFLETTEADWDRLMAINVKSMVLMTQAILPGMLERGKGEIINMASISGFSASAMESAYCTTKGAVLQLTKAIAVEFRDRGIRCNAISPGFIRTPHGLREMEECVQLGIDFSDADIANMQGRFCEPEEIANVVTFLASEDASFINGASITVDNTWTAST